MILNLVATEKRSQLRSQSPPGGEDIDLILLVHFWESYNIVDKRA